MVTHAVFIYIEAMGKPRMTRRDKWAKRPCVVRYRAYADILRHEVKKQLPGIDISKAEGVSWTAFMKMPNSWSAKKKEAMSLQYHKSKPDIDNIEKGILDALLKDDSGIAHTCCRKIWNDQPMLSITFYLP